MWFPNRTQHIISTINNQFVEIRFFPTCGNPQVENMKFHTSFVTLYFLFFDAYVVISLIFYLFTYTSKFKEVATLLNISSNVSLFETF